MEQSVKKLAELMKKMQTDRAAERATDRENFNALKTSLDANTEAMKELVGWGPRVDSKVEDLKGSVEELRVKVDLIAQKQEEMRNPAYKVFQHEEIDLTKPAVAHLTAPPMGAASGPNGHHDDFIHRSIGHGVVITIAPTPVKGANNALDITPVSFTLGGNSHASSDSSVSLMNMSFLSLNLMVVVLDCGERSVKLTLSCMLCPIVFK